MSSDEERHEDARRDAIDERREWRRNTRCQCAGEDMPGQCPGPAFCPYSDFNRDDAA